jgi:hypothetical protein
VGVISLKELSRYADTEIIVGMNIINNKTQYYSIFLSDIPCEKNINNTITEEIIIKHKLQVNKTYIYYCDCIMNQCSFTKLYNIMTTYQMLCIIIGIIIIIISAIMIICDIITKNRSEN